MTDFIWRIAGKYPAIARTTAISFYWALISLVTYIWNSLVSWDFTDYRAAIWLFLSALSAWVIEWISKRLRDKKKELESM